MYLQSTLNNVYDQSNQSHKFLKWVETNITYTNYYPSVIENIEKETTSILAQSVYSNINSTIEGVLNYSTNLYFKDPWFRDKYDLKGWNNRGMEAVWHEGTNFDLSLDSEYQGVIIDQDFTIQNLPVYSIKTTSPQFVNINGTSNKIYFQKWECNPVGSVTFEDSHTLESSVTFHQDNSEVKAVFKGTDLTEDVYAIDNNSQSKIIRIGSGANDDLYKVYESLDCVWLEKSTNNGSSWEIMNNGKPLNDIDQDLKGKSPSIAMDYGRIENFYIVFQEYSDFGYGGDAAKIKVIYYKNAPLPVSLIEDYLPNVQFTGNMSSDTQPVIAKTVYDRLLIVWRVPIGFETAGTPAGLYYHYVGHRYNQSTFDWKNSGDDPIKISNTSSATYNPTLAVDWSGYSDPFHLAWQYGLGNVQYYQLSQTSGRSTITPQYFETISSGSGFNTNRSPSIAIIQHQPVVSWYSQNSGLGGHIDLEDPPSVVKKVVSRRKIGSSWSNFFQNGNDVSTHYLASSRDNNVLLIWNEYVNGNYISKVVMVQRKKEFRVN